MTELICGEINTVAHFHTDTMRAATLLLVFLLTDLLGSEEVQIMRKISVKNGQTVVIPCLYDAYFATHPKYISFGPVFMFSHYTQNKRFSLLDYKTRNFFTATLSSAQVGDSAKYWCGVSFPGPDDGTQFVLEVTEGDTKLHVSSQNVTAYEGGNISIQCYGASKWCKIGGSCAEENIGTLDKTKVDISGDDKVLSVTLKALQKEDAGWYFCSDGQSQIPVYIHVSLGMPSHLKDKSVPPVNFTTPSDHKQSLWLVILGPVLSIIIFGAVILFNFQKKKQRADASEIYERMDGIQIPQESNNERNALENVYEVMSITKSNIKQTVKDDIYATVVKQSRSSDSP